jgi:hypothetical protein
MLSGYETSSVSRGNVSKLSQTKFGEKYMTQEKFNTKVERLTE